MKNNHSIKEFYTKCSFHLLNIIVIFLFMNIFSFIYLYIYTNKKKENFNIDTEAYYNKNQIINCDSTYVREVINDFTSFSNKQNSGFKYHPIAEYTQSDFISKHINIIASKNDYNQRIIIPTYENKNRDSIISIFCFGGSTTFGWNVSDEHSWPSLLQKTLMNEHKYAINIKNYGCAGYSATQETNQFIDLLKLGHRPSLCIFMDGLNTGPIWDASEFSVGFSERLKLDEINNNVSFWSFIKGLPLNKLITSILKRDYKKNFDKSLICPIEYSANYNNQIINRFIENAKIRQSIADNYGIEIIHFLQPNIFALKDTFAYSNIIDSISKKDSVIYMMKHNYPVLYDAIEKSNKGFINLCDLIKTYPYMPVMDGVHYTPDFNLTIAKKVVEYISIDELKKYSFDASKSTGISFD